MDPTNYLKQKVRYIHRIIYQDDDGFFYLKKHEKFMSLGDLLSFYMVSEINLQVIFQEPDCI